MTAIAEPLPRWDTSAFFPSLSSQAFETAVQTLVGRLSKLEHLFDVYGVRKQQKVTVDGGLVSIFEEIIREYNDLSDGFILIRGFVTCFNSVDSRDELAQAKRSLLQREMVRFAQLSNRLTAWIGSIDVEALKNHSSLARSLAFMLEQTHITASHQMSEGEEELVAMLQPTTLAAWNKLHGDLTSQLSASVRLPQGETTLPMSAVRGLAKDPSSTVREAAYRAELEAWPKVALPLAAALNSIKGQQGLLVSRRGWASPVELACFNTNIDRETLEAMHASSRRAFPDFRRYFRAKARLLGHSGSLPWWDMFAPVGAQGREWTWDEVTRFISERFDSYSSRLGDFARRAFRESWVDAEPRDGKVGGAFCMRVRGDESRILMNFEPSLDSVSTLAHELGHAYHNLNLAHRSALERLTPMTLAETASIFCETIVTNAALERAATPEERLAILETELQGQAQVVVDIHARFLFETRLFERRQERELSVKELNELMTEAMRETYGDGLEASTLHPYMWAVKGHYYGSLLYNFPYMFGLLFGLGLFAQYEKNPEDFRANYDDLLSSTGLADAATLAERFGLNIREEAFWDSSFDLIRRRIDAFEALVKATNR